MITKELLKELLTRKAKYNKAYKTMIDYYKVYFDSIGLKDSIVFVEQDLGIRLNYNTTEYYYSKIYGKKKKTLPLKSTITPTTQAPQLNDDPGDNKFLNASDIQLKEPKYKF
ncbi:MAG: hypothetical protein C0459_13720 [Chitinophaga sp.]|nr:hypothetical protein [Chitinophaga sp.]